jgi:hypothetical protein
MCAPFKALGLGTADAKLSLRLSRSLLVDLEVGNKRFFFDEKIVIEVIITGVFIIRTGDPGDY